MACSRVTFNFLPLRKLKKTTEFSRRGKGGREITSIHGIKFVHQFRHSVKVYRFLTYGIPGNPSQAKKPISKKH